jgi:drug/metabolite transporter (DMT)-like permease
VAVVLCRGDVHQLLQLRLVEGDLFMLAATVSWSLYSWLLSRTAEPASIRQDWKSFLVAQMLFGVVWAGALALIEQTTMHPAPVAWSPWLIVAIIFIALGPGLLAYRCWGLAVEKSGPTTAGFFANFIPLFAAVLSMPVLHEAPKPFHAVAFALVVGGITLSSKQNRKA